MKISEILNEQKTGNEARGYHGEWGADGNKKFAAMHKRVKKLTGASSEMVTHYLDSVRGRHVADVEKNDDGVDEYIASDFKKFAKKYDPSLFD